MMEVERKETTGGKVRSILPVRLKVGLLNVFQHEADALTQAALGLIAIAFLQQL